MTVAGAVTVSCGDVDAIVGHGGLCRGNVNGYHMPQMLSVRYPTDINPELQFPESRCARERPRDHFNRGLLRPCWGQGGMSYPEQDALSQSPSGWEGSRRPHLNSADAGEGLWGEDGVNEAPCPCCRNETPESVSSAQHRSKIELCCVRTGQTARLYSGNIEVCAADPNAAVVRGRSAPRLFLGTAMFTPLECRLRSADCQRMMAHAPNPRLQAILLDISRTWTRLALEAEQTLKESRPPLQLIAPKSASRDLTPGNSEFA
jgi:hypothetical protein